MKVLNHYTQFIPTEPEKGIEYHTSFFTAVLVEGDVEDYAVYLGIGSVDWIAAHGRKCNYKEALNYFPLLEEAKYRA